MHLFGKQILFWQWTKADGEGGGTQ